MIAIRLFGKEFGFVYVAPFLAARFWPIWLSLDMDRLLFLIVLPLSDTPYHFIQLFELGLISFNILKPVRFILVIEKIVIVCGNATECFTRLSFIFQLTILMSFVNIECRYGTASFCQFQKLLKSLYFLCYGL